MPKADSACKPGDKKVKLLEILPLFNERIRAGFSEINPASPAKDEIFLPPSEDIRGCWGSFKKAYTEAPPKVWVKMLFDANR